MEISVLTMQLPVVYMLTFRSCERAAIIASERAQILIIHGAEECSGGGIITRTHGIPPDYLDDYNYFKFVRDFKYSLGYGDKNSLSLSLATDCQSV